MKCFVVLLSIIIVFWNLENFFLPGSPKFEKIWTSRDFYRKCEAVTKTILTISDQYENFPDVIAVEEIESRQVLQKLTSATLLRKLDYSIIHYESPDTRGIDCALLYRKSRLHLLYSSAVPVLYPGADTVKTRSILVAGFETPEGDSIAIVVNHHPSKISSSADYRRELSLKTLRSIADSIHIRNIVSGGDFNEEYRSEADTILPPALEEVKNILSRSGNSTGTIRFNGKWETIDRIQTAGNIEAEVKIFDDNLLSEKDLTYGGMKPKRAFSGPRFTGGISDHYPIIVEIQSRSTFAKPGPGD